MDCTRCSQSRKKKLYKQFMATLEEVLPFLADGKQDAQELAVRGILPFTATSAGHVWEFKADDFTPVKRLKLLASSPRSAIKQSALTALVNLTDDKEIRALVAQDIATYAAWIVDPAEENKALICMLLANLSHDPAVASIVGPPLEVLVATLVKDVSPDLDFLTFLFAETARRPATATFWTPEIIGPLFPQIVLASLQRRSGIAATVKNTLFRVQMHEQLGKHSKLIEYIMIALKGPEPLDEEDRKQLPDVVQDQLTPKKRRETNNEQILLLLECFLLMSTSRAGREALRDKKAYFIVREVHSAVENPDIMETCERIVNQIMRGEPEPAPSQDASDSDDDDDAVIEVI